MNTPKQRKKAAKKVINVRRIMNPFDPLRDIRDEQWSWKKGRTLAHYLPLGTTDDYVVSRNGGMITSEDFDKVLVERDDFIVLCPVPRGGQGGGGKMLLRIVGMIVIAVASYFTMGAASSAYGPMMGAMAGAAVSIAGSILLNALLPPPVATNGGSGGLDSSATYGADGAKNTSAENLPVPLTYGQFRQAGNLVGIHTENDGNNQVLYMLINAGEGPIASIADVQLNGRSVSEFSEASIQTRMGDETQAIIDWFSKTVVPYTKSQMLPADGSYLTFATETDVEQVRLDMTFPSGLFAANKNTGALGDNTVAVEADYRKVGDANWTGFSTQPPSYQNISVWPMSRFGWNPLPGHGGIPAWPTPWNPDEPITSLNVTARDGSGLPQAVIDAAYLKFGSYVGQPVKNWPQSDAGVVYTTVMVPPQPGALLCTDNSRSTVRRSFTSPNLVAGRYEIRVRRNDNYVDYTVNGSTGRKVYQTNLDSTLAMSDCYVSDLNEVTFDGVAYNHTALLAVRVKLDQQLNGVPSVTFLHGGRLINTMSRNDGTVTTYQSASTNPAFILWDILTDTRWGGAIDPARLDLDSFLDWAAYCDAQGLTFNGVLDTVMNVWDAASYVSACGHAQLLTVGTRYYVAIERASDPVMMFGMGNIVQDSFKQSWMSRTDRATEIDVTFFDKTDSYKQKTVKVTDQSLAIDGAKQNVSAITAYGVVDIQRAYREGAFRLNLNRYLTQTCEWQSPIEAIACTAGDVVLLQHDMPAWAESGRTAAGSTNRVIQLDKPVTMVAGKQYKLLILNNYVVRGSAVISGITGSFLHLSNGTPQNVRLRRVRAGAVDVGITSFVGDGVYVDSTDGLFVGQAVELLDTDVVEDSDVSFNEGEHTAVTLVMPLGYSPEPFVNYMFGESTKVKKPFRITQITLGSTDMTRQISALEYRAEVYDLSSYGDVADTLTPPMLDPRQAAISQVQNLSAYEETYVSGSQILSDVRVSWSQPLVGSYAGADVYLQINGGAFNKAGTVRADTSYALFGVSKGQNIVVRVVAFDIWGKYASYDQAPSVGYTVVGNVSNLSVAAVTGADFLWAGRDCKIYWNYNSTTSSFEFGSEPEGAQGARDPHFMDYEVRIYDKNTPRNLLRTEHTTDNSYIYTFEKNFADGLHRRVVFEIAVRDTFGHMGSPAVLDAYNPPPTVLTAADTADFDRATVQYTHSDDPDFAGAVFYLSDVSPVKFVNENVAYNGPDSSVLLSNLMFNRDYYLVIVPYDAFGLDETIPTNEIHFRTPFLDVEAIAEGVLKDSQLIPALQQRINLVDGNGIGSVNQRVQDAVSAEQSARQTAMTAEANARAIADGVLTAAITTEQQTRQSATDSLSSSITTLGARVNTNAAAVQTEQTARASADSALGTRIDTVVATSASNTAAISTEATARTNADGALSTRIDAVVATNATNTAAITTEQNARVAADGALSTRIDSVSASTGANTAAISAEQTARTSADSALSTRVDSVVASYGLDLTNLCANPVAAGNQTTGWTTATAVGGTTGDVPLGAPAANVFRQNIRDNAYTTRTVPVSSGQQHYLEMRVATPVAAVPISIGLHLTGLNVTETWVWAATQNATSSWTRMSGMVTIPAGYTTAQLCTMVDFGGGVNNDKNRWYFTDVEWRPANQTQPAMAAITAEQTARTSADSALSTRIDTLSASVGTNTAAIATEQTARANGDSANASAINTLTTTVNGHTASIQAQSSSINGLSAQYTVKIDNNGYVTGYGLASYAVNGQIVSEFAVRTDTFSVNLPGYPSIHPFTIGAVYGVPRVIISNALIGDASIDNAKIGDAQINTAKILDASITTAKIADANITSAKIGYAQINTAHIGDLTIDTARIGQNAVSTMGVWAGGGFNSGFSFTYPANGGSQLMIVTGNGYSNPTTITVDGNNIGSAPIGSVIALSMGAGGHSISSSNAAKITILEMKR
ncbi:phage tail protein [Paraburkholderia sp. RCC_158]|uniref:phage tail protein n=1 Tax=Paraburkholderia sp. RCC_158 TaxID=3239220 RepID=UPI0035232316